jgi:ribosomal protein S18 acetylase RimI-like enzyme
MSGDQARPGPRRSVTGSGRGMLQRFHTHLHDAWGGLARSTPTGWVDDADGLTCIATGSTSPSFNLAITGAGRGDPEAALDGALRRYRHAGLRWLLKLQPELDRELVAHARHRGIAFDEEPVYGISLRPWTDPAPPGGLSVSVAGRDTIEDAVRCFAESFGVDPADVRRELGPNLLTVPSFTVFVGYLGSEPVATSMLATTPGVRLAGVYSVATRPSHQGRGFGTALTRAALVAARAQGYETAVLEPSEMGAPMYRRMGFEPIGSYLEAVMPPPRDEDRPGAAAGDGRVTQTATSPAAGPSPGSARPKSVS